MNKLGAAKILISLSILLITAFQVYWLKRLYNDELRSFKRSIDVNFRETMLKLQIERLKSDTSFLGNKLNEIASNKGPASNLKMNIRVSGDSLRGYGLSFFKKTDSLSRKNQSKTFLKTDSLKLISIESNFTNEEDGDTRRGNFLMPLFSSKNSNDTLPFKTLDSAYTSALQDAGIEAKFIIKKLRPSDKNNVSLNIIATRNVTIDYFNNVAYRAEFENASLYIIKKISPQIVLSFLLLLLTATSFIFIYRSYIAQRKLTQIKNEFIGNITHELKTPISTVSVAIEAMKNFNVLQHPERSKEYLDIAEHELSRLSLLVDKVLKLSMFEKHKVELKYEWLDVKVLIEEVINSMLLQFEKAQANINLNIEGNNFSIYADRLHLMSVIYNLLDNALKYCNRQPNIEVLLQEKENDVFISVKDNGIGIAAQYREKIFEKFFRISDGNHHNVKGYGLGLSYVAHIVQQHHGYIRIESEPEKGSVFIIQLPKKYVK